MTINNITELALAEREVVQEQQAKEKVVNEEFKIWKKTVPLLYDSIHTHALDFPSLSVKWLPQYQVSSDKSKITVQFLYGTNSSQHSQDYLKLGSIDLPSTLAPDFAKFNQSAKLTPPPEGSSTTNFQVMNTWKHNGEINKLQLSPNSKSVLTSDNEGMVHWYNLQDASAPVDFKYHKLECYELEWISDAEFLSGSNDSQIALWEVLKPSTPLQSFKSHHAIINDLSLNQQHKKLFASSSDDYTVKIHDLRSPAADSVAIDVETKQIQNAVKFHPEISTLLATGGRDNIVNVYDLRNPSTPFRKLFGHNDSVTGLKWDENNPQKLTSWSLDKRVIIWDLDNLDEEFQYPTSSSEGPKRGRSSSRQTDPCLSFISAGHTNRINEVDVHPKISGLHITTGDDNLLEVWKPKTIIPEEEEEEENQEE